MLKRVQQDKDWGKGFVLYIRCRIEVLKRVQQDKDWENDCGNILLIYRCRN